MVEYVTRDEFGRFTKSVGIRFDGVDKRFDGVDKRFDGVDKRFDGVDKRFDGIDGQLLAINNRFDELVAVIGETIAKAVITIEENVTRRVRDELGGDLARQIRASEERLRGEIRAIDDQYRDLPDRVTRLEQHTGLKR